LERNGALVDGGLLRQQSQQIGKRLAELENEAYNLAGEEFNLASPKQLQEIFFEKLGLPVIKKTPKGQPSTAEPILQELALDYPLPKLILEHRGGSNGHGSPVINQSELAEYSCSQRGGAPYQSGVYCTAGVQDSCGGLFPD
jgi:hypothetical protein